MPPASPAIARARRAPNPFHLLLTVIGRHDQSLLFLTSPLAVGLAMQLLMDGRTEGHVVRALHIGLGKKEPLVGGSVSRPGQILDFE